MFFRVVVWKCKKPHHNGEKVFRLKIHEHKCKFSTKETVIFGLSINDVTVLGGRN